MPHRHEKKIHYSWIFHRAKKYENIVADKLQHLLRDGYRYMYDSMNVCSDDDVDDLKKSFTVVVMWIVNGQKSVLFWCSQYQLRNLTGRQTTLLIGPTHTTVHSVHLLPFLLFLFFGLSPPCHFTSSVLSLKKWTRRLHCSKTYYLSSRWIPVQRLCPTTIWLSFFIYFVV